MDDPQAEFKESVVKILMYIGGTILGLAAKLVIVSKKSNLTWQKSLGHSIVAFACSFLVWHIMRYYSMLDFANIASVIVGRYGDLILMAVWSAVKDIINKKSKDI